MIGQRLVNWYGLVMESFGIVNLMLEKHPVRPSGGDPMVTHMSLDLVVHLYGERRCIASRVMTNAEADSISEKPRLLMDMAIDLLRRGLTP